MFVYDQHPTVFPLNRRRRRELRRGSQVPYCTTCNNHGTLGLPFRSAGLCFCFVFCFFLLSRESFGCEAAREFQNLSSPSLTSHADILRGSSRVPAPRGVVTRDEPLRTSAWEATLSPSRAALQLLCQNFVRAYDPAD